MTTWQPKAVEAGVVWWWTEQHPKSGRSLTPEEIVEGILRAALPLIEPSALRPLTDDERDEMRWTFWCVYDPNTGNDREAMNAAFNLLVKLRGRG